MKPLSMGEPEYRRLARMARQVEFFAPFTGAELDRLLGEIRLYAWSAGQRIFRAGDAGEAFYLVADGRLAVLQPRRFWPSREIAVLGPGDFFGEMALLDREARTATVAAKTAVRLFVLLRADFERVCRQNPSFTESMKRLAARRQFETPR